MNTKLVKLAYVLGYKAACEKRAQEAEEDETPDPKEIRRRREKVNKILSTIALGTMGTMYGSMIGDMAGNGKGYSTLAGALLGAGLGAGAGYGVGHLSNKITRYIGTDPLLNTVRVESARR